MEREIEKLRLINPDTSAAHQEHFFSQKPWKWITWFHGIVRMCRRICSSIQGIPRRKKTYAPESSCPHLFNLLLLFALGRSIEVKNYLFIVVIIIVIEHLLHVYTWVPSYSINSLSHAQVTSTKAFMTR